MAKSHIPGSGESNRNRASLIGTPVFFWMLFGFSLLVYWVAQSSIFPTVFHKLELGDNDNFMRLLSVRSFLAGQDWYDMTQYRFVPPDGVSLHWSRYVDLGIASLQRAMSVGLSHELAERLSVVAWPAMLYTAFLGLTAWFSYRLFGPQAASLSLLPVVFMLVIFQAGYFAIGRIDHHNLQMLCMLSMTYLTARDERPFSGGIFAGVVAAFSLAIGLETLLFVAAAGVTLTAIFVIFGRAESTKLLGFGLGLGVAAPIFFAGQTAPAEWSVAYCDKLSPPVLWLTTGALIFSAIVHFSFPRSATLLFRICTVILLGAVAIAILWPRMAPCATGPYGALPAELREAALPIILEARSLPERVADYPGYFFLTAFPALSVIIAAGLVLVRRIGIACDPTMRRRAMVLLFFLSFAFVCLFYQVRFLVAVFSVLPLAFGFAVAALLCRPLGPRPLWQVILITTVVISVIGNTTLSTAANRIGTSISAVAVEGTGADSSTRIIHDARCRDSDVLDVLNSLPPKRILSSVNLGPMLAVHTHHLPLAAPYHRSLEAMRNGFEVFPAAEDSFLAALPHTGAEYLLVCNNSEYSADSVASKLAAGEARDWAQPVHLGSGPLRLFRLKLPQASSE